MGLVRDVNVNAVAIMDEVEGQTELDRFSWQYHCSPVVGLIAVGVPVP